MAANKKDIEHVPEILLQAALGPVKWLGPLLRASGGEKGSARKRAC